LNEHEIIRLLRMAAQVEPSTAEHAAVVARVRLSSADRAAASSIRSGRRWRLWVGAAAAAGALLLGLAAILIATRPRTAWAELEAAAEASGEFRGWVSVRGDRPTARPFMIFDTERFSRASFGPADKDGRWPVRLMDHRRATDSYWSPAAGAIFVSELSPAELETTYEWYSKRFNIAVNFREQLENMRKAMGAGNLDVRSDRDGPLERFDMNWFLRDASGRRQPTPVDAMSYWVDPNTHLIAKMRHVRQGAQPSTLVYEYNHPVVNDIYDLGVPRDAKVVDNRPTGAVKDLLDALDRRIEAGTGDGVAVVATVTARQDAAGKGPILDTLEIYGRSRDRWVWARYLVGRAPGRDPEGNASQPQQLAPPPGWPNIEPAAAVALVNGVQPDDLFVRDGNRAYRSFKGSKGLLEDEPGEMQDAAYFGVPGRYWPGRFRLRLYLPPSVASLRQEADGSQTISVVEMDWSGATRHASHEITLSKQTGLPTAAAYKIFGGAGVELYTERWTFVSDVRTPAGIILPARWTDETFAPPDKRYSRKEATLRFDPDARVPETWFDPPSRRFKNQ
jgi:hypothetical protein